MSSRLLTGFGLVTLLLALVAALGIAHLRSLNSQVDQLANNRVPQLILAGKWQASVMRNARHMQTVFVLSEANEINEELKAIRANRAERLELLKQLKALVVTERGKALLRQMEDVQKAYTDAEDEFVKDAEGNKFEDAKVTLLMKARPMYNGYLDGIGKYVELVATESGEMARESQDTYRNSIGTSVAVALLAVAAALAIAVLIARGLRRQLGGEPGYAVSVVKKVAAGDLTVDVRVDDGDHNSLLYATREMVANLRQLAGEVAGGARTVSDTSAQIAQGNLDLSQRTEEQASTLEETASSMEELTSTVTQNAENARQASQLATGACDVARKGGDAVEKVVVTMDEIWRASRKIADIISVIDGIAFQTNILALNAAVEAARSGEHGRGFAVVAAEVRSLAQRSAAAAKEIKGLIEDSAQKVQAGGALVDDAGHTMVEVVMTVEKVSRLISEIAAASREQSTGIQQVTDAVGQMDRVVQQNATLVEEAAAATESMKDQAAMLLQMVARFKLAEGDTGDGAQEMTVTPLAQDNRGAPPVDMMHAAPLLR